ncbi:MAG: beta-N-acetylhexosaminidase [Phycisphaerales bacterium]
MIIPKPMNQEARPGAFQLSQRTRVYLAMQEDDRRGKWIGQQLSLRLGLEHPGCIWLGSISRATLPAGTIVIIIDPSEESLGAEGYWMTVEREMVTLCASGYEGAYFATESLIQLATPRAEATDGNGRKRSIPCVRIKDQPRYPWRGLMIDSARHFQDVPLIKSWIDRMASLKINRFHWHLTDDEAWRIEIDKYPRLTELAAWRTEGGQRYGGFYTKDQAREIVSYANARGITVIPEIEMPGHCNAALYAYPHLSCCGRPLKIGHEGWNAYTQVEGRLPFCVGRDATLEFIKDVLREVAEVFDSPYIHVGGDERPAGVWSECPHCNERMRRAGLANEDELHVWFMSQIADFVSDELKRVSIGWAEKLDIGMPENQIIQGWHAGQSDKVISAGRQTINSTHEWVYLDYPWSLSGQEAKPKWMPVLPLRKVYEFEPAGDTAGGAGSGLLLGSEAPIWTEFITTQEELQQHVMPRLAALSEVLWSASKDRDYNDFKRRLLRLGGRSPAVISPVVTGSLAKRVFQVGNKSQDALKA